MFTNRIKSVLSLALIILSFNLSATVYQTVSDGNWNSNKVWTPNKPNPNWNNTSDTIIINHTVVIPQNISFVGQTLIISKNGKIEGNKKITLSNASSFIVNGELDIKEVKMTWGLAYFENNGNIILNSLSIESSIFINNSNLIVDNSVNNSWNAVLYNNASITADGFVNDGDSLFNIGTINLNKDFKSNSSNSIYMYNGGSINALRDFQYYLVLDNDGDISVGRNFIANWNSSTNNSGEIVIENSFENRGIFNTSDDITIKGDAQNTADLIINSGNFKVEGDMLNDWGSDLNNLASVEILGDLNNRNTISNSGNLSIDNNVVNQGIIDNLNYISVGNDFIVRYFSSIVSNNGVIAVNQNLDNEGNISNNGNLTVDGLANSAGSISGSGDLCNSDGQTDPTQGSKNITCNICGTDATTLPVELSHFSAKPSESAVELKWITESEINNHYFEIQRSNNGVDFTTISVINGNGNSNSQIVYTAIDDNPEASVNYYRLKQVDFDASFEYSDILAVEINNQNDFEANVFPNPIRLGDNININVSDEKDLKVQIFSVDGKLVYNQRINSSSYEINTSSFNTGFYILKISSFRTTITKKLQIVL